MKVEIIKDYQDLKLDKIIAKGTVLTVEIKRAKELIDANVAKEVKIKKNK